MVKNIIYTLMLIAIAFFSIMSDSDGEVICGTNTDPNPGDVETIKVPGTFTHVKQESTIYCAAAVTQMIALWKNRTIPSQAEMMSSSDSDGDGKINVNELIDMVENYAYNTCYHYYDDGYGFFDTASNKVLGECLEQIDRYKLPSILWLDYNSTRRMHHVILIRGFTGKLLKTNGVAYATHALIDDPLEDNKNDAYSFTLLKPRMENFFRNYVQRVCQVHVLEFPYNNNDVVNGYLAALENCATYYGGPEIYIPEGSTFLRVRYPLGSETLAHDRNEQIIWEANGLSGQIKLELYKNDTLKGTIAQNLPIGNGSYNWTAGQYQGGSVQTGENYKIKVAMMDNSYDDFSNVYFNLGSVSVNSPNGGETWEQGSLRYITWDSSYFTGDVQLWLRKTIPGTDYLIIDRIANTGIYEWTVGQCTDVEENRGMIIPGDNCYKIKVVSYDNPNLMDSSNDVFSIAAPQPSITVVAPNGGGTTKL